MRNTEQRKKILKVLQESTVPMTCEDIMKSIKNSKLNLSTIYRSLEKFKENDYVIETIINKKKYFYTGSHHHFLFCSGCETIIPVECDFHEKENEIAKPYNFSIHRHEMTIYGLCFECRN